MTRAFMLVAVVLSGCASSLSGLDATNSYGCKAPEGVSCISVSGTYANSTHGSLSRGQSAPAKSSDAPGIYGASSVVMAQPAAPGNSSNAVRSNPRLLRVWIAPWEDSDGDLHEDGYVHMVVGTGRWLIEHVRPALRSKADRVAPPLAPAPDTSAAETPSPSDARLPFEP